MYPEWTYQLPKKTARSYAALGKNEGHQAAAERQGLRERASERQEDDTACQAESDREEVMPSRRMLPPPVRIEHRLRSLEEKIKVKIYGTAEKRKGQWSPPPPSSKKPPIKREKGQGPTWLSRTDKVMCWRCGKVGHYARGCPDPPTRRSYPSEGESAPCCGHMCSGNGGRREYAPLGYLQIRMGYHKIEELIDTGAKRTLLDGDSRALLDDLEWRIVKDPNSQIRMANGALADFSEAVTGEVELNG